MTFLPIAAYLPLADIDIAIPGVGGVGMLVCGIVTALIADARGRSAVPWFLIGFLLHIFGILLVVLLPSVEGEDRTNDAIHGRTRSQRDNHRPGGDR